MLTDTWLRTAKGRDKPYKQSDSGGLYIHITPDARKHWRLAYRFDGKQKLLALGSYPEVSLREAREKREAAKHALRAGTDPSVAKAQAKREAGGEPSNSFEAVALAWYKRKTKSLTSDRYAAQIFDRLKNNVFPVIGPMEISAIKPQAILAMLQKIEDRGATTMAKRVKEHCAAVFRYGIVQGLVERDPCADLKDALQVDPPVKHHTVVREDELPDLVRDIDGYAQAGGELITQLALKLAMLTLLRTSELRGGLWAEIEGLEGRSPVWRVPDERMKMTGRDGHLVPLPRQAVDLLRQLHELTGFGPLMFPGEKLNTPMSNNTMLFALYRLGYRSRQTVHGFRRIASTVLNESKLFRADVIEKQLAHEEKNKIRRAYNAAEYLAERREMLQWYADHLDGLRGPAQVIPLIPARRAGARR